MIELHCHICNHQVKCIQISTNMPSNSLNGFEMLASDGPSLPVLGRPCQCWAVLASAGPSLPCLAVHGLATLEREPCR